jgi:hypothetical protein
MDPLKKLNELEQRIHHLTNEARQAADEREKLTKMVECQTEDRHIWDFDTILEESTYNQILIWGLTCLRCGTTAKINVNHKIFKEEEE